MTEGIVRGQEEKAPRLRDFLFECIDGYSQAILLEEEIVSIRSYRSEELTKGMTVEVFTNETDVAPGFVDGDIGVITGFAMPHTNGTVERIVKVCIKHKRNIVTVRPAQVRKFYP